MRINLSRLLIAGLFLIHCSIHGQDVTVYSPRDIQDNFIDDQIFEKAIIWLDVRDDNEVAAGVIASEFCKPYHVSWNFDWDNKYSDLPKDTPIIIYCRSGHRASLAAADLKQKGYDENMVTIMSGGIIAYTGTKTKDSTLVKPWNELPEPSYSFKVPVIHHTGKNNEYRPYLTPVSGTQLFNLKGQLLHQSAGNGNIQLYILEKCHVPSLEKSRGRIQLLRKNRYTPPL